MNLYDITSQYTTALSMVDEDWVITDEGLALLDKAELDIKDKAKNISHELFNRNYNNENISKEIKRLQTLKKVNTDNINKLKDNLQISLKTAWIDKLDLWTFKISYRKSQQVIIENEDEFITEYMGWEFIVAKHTPNKTAIWNALKDWQKIIGCKLVTKNNLQIK